MELKLALMCVGKIGVLGIVCVVLLISIGLIVGLDLDLRRVIAIGMLLRLLLVVVARIIHRCNHAIWSEFRDDDEEEEEKSTDTGAACSNLPY